MVKKLNFLMAVVLFSLSILISGCKKADSQSMCLVVLGNAESSDQVAFLEENDLGDLKQSLLDNSEKHKELEIEILGCRCPSSYAPKGKVITIQDYKRMKANSTFKVTTHFLIQNLDNGKYNLKQLNMRSNNYDIVISPTSKDFLFGFATDRLKESVADIKKWKYLRT